MISEVFKSYRPIIMMNNEEPFLPKSIGCTLFTETQQSPSFNRCIKVEGETEIVLEYAIYWDYDIQHLYDLEHIWVYIDKNGNVINCEASFHGKFLRGLLKGRENIVDERHVVLFCQPGKHAFAPRADVFELLPNYENCTSSQAGKDGLCITKICENRISTTDVIDDYIKEYLKDNGFTASEEYYEYEISEDLLVPFEILYENIPLYLESEIKRLMKMNTNNGEIKNKLELLGDSFEPFLSASNPNVVASLTKLGYNEDDIRRIELFDWFQGVGLYGYYEMYRLTSDEKYLSILLNYFDVRISDGLPAKNINSMAPMLTLISLYDDGLLPATVKDTYEIILKEWAEWLYSESPRTVDGGFAHLTCEAANAQELWDDTLFMAVLFLGKAGCVFHREAYVDEAVYQFMIHYQYLGDKNSGFWFHGYTFDGNHNFVEAKWARGNSWITIFVPLFIEICKDYPLGEAVKRHLKQAYDRQVKALLECQVDSGLWHTLLDDPSSYEEASAAAGFIWGIVKGLNTNILENSSEVMTCVKLGTDALLKNINDEGILEQVSGGTPMGKDSLDFYRNIPLVPKPYGQAMAMAALVEVLKEKNHD